MRGYFFFAFALDDDFLDEEAFFFVANVLTTFHAVRDLTVAPLWQSAGSLRQNF